MYIHTSYACLYTYRVELFGALFRARLFFGWGGWRRLELYHFCTLRQENVDLLTSSSLCNPTLLIGLRVLQPSTRFRAEGVATQHSF